MPRIYRWRELFSAQGRYGRGEFWGVFGALTITNALIVLLDISEPSWAVLGVLLYVPMVLVGTNNVTKRLHDQGLSGWWQLLPGLFIAIGAVLDETPGNPLGEIAMLIGSLASIIWFGCLPGQKGANRFGPPKSDTAPDRGDLPEQPAP